MTTKTTLDQLCTTTKDAFGSTKFVVDNTLTYVAPGDLPSASVFVFKLGTGTDPKTDEFLRIGDIQDITNTVIGRDNAIIAKASIYLANGFTKLFDDVATANAAKLLIQARLDQLIADWHIYTESFVSPVQATFPLQDASLVAAKKAAYDAALTEKAAADAALIATSSGLAEKKLATETATKLQGIYQDSRTKCVSVQSKLGAIRAADTSFNTAMDAVTTALSQVLTTVSNGTVLADVKAAVAAYQSSLAAWQTATASKNNNVTLPLQSLETEVISNCNGLLTALNTATAEKAAADTAYVLAQRDSLLAKQTASTAQTTVETALSEVLEVCPTFEP